VSVHYTVCIKRIHIHSVVFQNFMSFYIRFLSHKPVIVTIAAVTPFHTSNRK